MKCHLRLRTPHDFDEPGHAAPAPAFRRDLAVSVCLDLARVHRRFRSRRRLDPKLADAGAAHLESTIHRASASTSVKSTHLGVVDRALVAVLDVLKDEVGEDEVPFRRQVDALGNELLLDKGGKIVKS